MLDLLVVLAVIAATASFIAIIRPIPKIHLPTRKRAALVFIITCVISGGLSAEKDKTNVQPTTQTTQTAQTTQTKPKPKPEPKKVTPTNITFEEVYEKFSNESQLTDLRQENEWKKYENKCIEWTGILVELEDGVFSMTIRMQHKKTLVNQALGKLGYDVEISAPKNLKEQFLSWQTGHSYTYQGTIESMSIMKTDINIKWGCN